LQLINELAKARRKFTFTPAAAERADDHDNGRFGQIMFASIRSEPPRFTTLAPGRVVLPPPYQCRKEL
jgi:hypothetical protein